MAERRVCSVLFVDLVGFTPLSESRDPEEVRELLSRYFDIARTLIGRYGGVVEKFIGDAVMAIWGTPVAREGDAERAVRAGLEVVSAVTLLGEENGAPGLAARAGVVTGEVAVTVGVVGEGVAGDVVNTASRVQSVAKPNEVWVDDVTMRLAGASVGFIDAGEHSLKGKAEPVRLWAATRVLSGLKGAQRADSLEAPLLGRDAELRTIKELFHASAERGSARLVVISGLPGVGKSRLGWEFEKYVDGLADVTRWHRGRCLSYGDGVAFWALAEIVRQRLGIAEEDPVAVAASKLADGLTLHVPNIDERTYIGLRLGRLLGVPISGDEGAILPREELFAGWRLFFERLADVYPVIILVEDAQHADAGLLDFLDHLVDWVRQKPIFILVFARPELERTRPGFGAGRNRSTLTVDPLDDTSMASLVDNLVPAMPPRARAAITDHSQGIPLFAVETIRSLIDRGVVVPYDGVYRLVADVGELAVPDSLHGLLAARLDTLDPSLRSLVGTAAVLGTSFPADALIAVSGRPDGEVRVALAELARREVLEISADPLSPQRGHYHFSQNLLRQVAYETLSRRDRKTIHLAVAAHLRSTFAGDGDEVIEAIASHYRDALELLPDEPDTPAIRAEATAALVRAADRAVRSGAPRTSASSYAAAAELTEDIDRSESQAEAARWWEEAARSAETSGDLELAISYADRAISIYRALGDVRAAARAEVVAGPPLLRIGRNSEARDRLTGALAVLRDKPDPSTVAALRELAAVAVFSGSDDADTLSSEALELGQALDVDEGQLADLFIIRGIGLLFAERHWEGAAHLQFAAQVAEQAGDSERLARALLNLSEEQRNSDPTASVVSAKSACELSRKMGARYMLAFAVGNLVTAEMYQGDWDGAETALRNAFEVDGLDDREELQLISSALMALRGDLDAAIPLAAAPTARSSEDPQFATTAMVADLMIAAAADDPAEVLKQAKTLLRYVDRLRLRHHNLSWTWPFAARAAYTLRDHLASDELIALIDSRPVGLVPAILRAERDLALARLAAREEADSLFASAVEALRRFASPFHLAHALVDHAEHLVEGEDPNGATELIEEAGSIARELRALPLQRRAEQVGARLASRIEVPR